MGVDLIRGWFPFKSRGSLLHFSFNVIRSRCLQIFSIGCDHISLDKNIVVTGLQP